MQNRPPLFTAPVSVVPFPWGTITKRKDFDMDIPTRVGLGGTALFTLAGLSQPLFGWWVAGPVMAVCTVVAGWGFWPIFRNHRLAARWTADGKIENGKIRAFIGVAVLCVIAGAIYESAPKIPITPTPSIPTVQVGPEDLLGLAAENERYVEAYIGKWIIIEGVPTRPIRICSAENGCIITMSLFPRRILLRFDASKWETTLTTRPSTPAKMLCQIEKIDPLAFYHEARGIFVANNCGIIF